MVMMEMMNQMRLQWRWWWWWLKCLDIFHHHDVQDCGNLNDIPETCETDDTGGRVPVLPKTVHSNHPGAVQLAAVSVQCALRSVLYSVFSVQCEVCSAQCAMRSVQWAVCSEKCAVRGVQSVVCSLQCTVHYGFKCYYCGKYFQSFSKDSGNTLVSHRASRMSFWPHSTIMHQEDHVPDHVL